MGQEMQSGRGQVKSKAIVGLILNFHVSGEGVVDTEKPICLDAYDENRHFLKSQLSDSEITILGRLRPEVFFDGQRRRWQRKSDKLDYYGATPASRSCLHLEYLLTHDALIT